MAILVTGGAGFIGSHLIGHLLEATDDTIVSVDNYNDYYCWDGWSKYLIELKERNASIYEGNPRVVNERVDIRRLTEMITLFKEHRFKAVFHLGSHGGVRHSLNFPMAYEETNVGGTLALLEMAKAFPVERFILASSSTIYGGDARIPLVEDDHLGVPKCPYGTTKRAAEMLAFNYHALHEVPTVCLRLFSVYGPRLRPDLAASIFSQAIVEGKEFELYGNAARDFTHVDDICRGFIAAMGAPNVVGEAINLGRGEPLAMKAVVQLLSAFLGEPARCRIMPGKPEDMDITYASLAKAKRLLNYEPTISFADGIVSFVDWFKEEVGYEAATDG